MVLDGEAALAAAAAALPCDIMPACDMLHVTCCMLSDVTVATLVMLQCNQIADLLIG